MEVKTTDGLGIKETKEVVLFAAALGNVISKAKEDGKITFEDALLLMPIIGLAQDAIKGIDKVPAELQDLDDAERRELVEEFAVVLKLSDDEKDVEEKVVLSLEVGLKLIQLANLF